MSTTGTNVVRMGVAGLLALAACLVVWWPQGASGSGGSVILGPIVAASMPASEDTPPTKTPTASQSPTKTPSATDTPSPPPPATGNGQPTSRPSSKPTKKPTKKPNSGGGNHHAGTIGANNGSGHGNGGGSTSGSGHGTSGTTTGATTNTTVVEDNPVTTDDGAADPGGGTGQQASTVEATPTEVVPSPAAVPTPASTDDSDTAPPETLLTNSEPVETESAPVWVVPGILLVLTAMLALLGGVLGRTRTARDES